MPDLGLCTQLALEPLQDLAPLEEGEVAEDVLQLLDADLGSERQVLALVHCPERAAADGLPLGVAAVEVGPRFGGGGCATQGTGGGSRGRAGGGGRGR